MRLLSPVKVGSRVRGRFKVLETRTDAKGRDIVKFGCEIEIEGGERLHSLPNGCPSGCRPRPQPPPEPLPHAIRISMP